MCTNADVVIFGQFVERSIGALQANDSLTISLRSRELPSIPRTETPILRKESRCALPTKPKPITAAVCFILRTPAYSAASFSPLVARYQLSEGP